MSVHLSTAVEFRGLCCSHRKKKEKSLTKQVYACLPLPVCGHILCRGIRPLPALLFDGPGCEELDRSEVRGRGGVGLMTQR